MLVFMIDAKPKKNTSKKSDRSCETHAEHHHPDHSAHLPRLNRVEGQLAGIQKMIREGRYCVDILVQFRAAMAALRSVEIEVFESHLQHCLASALHSKNKKQVDEKIKELTDLLSRRTSL